MPRNVRPAFLLLSMWAVAGALGAEPAPPAFAKMPVVAKAGDGCTVAFAADRATDVAVWIEDAKGQIVRHLAAGVLGDKAPAPLKAGSLEQALAWDGKDDDGAPAQGGPFKVHVALGLKANWGGTAFAEQSGPNHLTGVQGLAAGPGGRVYVTDSRHGWLYWPAYGVHVFRRDGSYERTIKPFAPGVGLERLGGLGAFRNERGYVNPLIHRVLGMTFYPFEDEPASQMAFAGGLLVHAVVPARGDGNPAYRGDAAHLAAVGPDGGIPASGFAGPALGKGLVWRGEKEAGGARLAGSSDGKSVFIVNLGTKYYENGYKFKRHPAVYRAPLPALGPAEVFFGDKDTPGKDEAHLNEPLGLAGDGKGLLYVADKGNDRVVILRESDAGFAGSVPVPAPEWVAVHPRSGALYVYGAGTLTKFSGAKDPKELARLDLKPLTAAVASHGRVTLGLHLALEASQDPAIVWVGRAWNERQLLRFEDQGSSFAPPQPAGLYTSPRHEGPISDPTHRLVLSKQAVGIGSRVEILDEASGEVRRAAVSQGPASSNQGTRLRLDRDGNIYSCSAAGGIWKTDTAGKRVPFAATADDPKLKGHLPAGSTGTTAWERDWYVDRKGDIYAKVRGTAYHGLMHIDVFAPDGTKKRTAVWGVSDGSYGPRVDAQGNVYVMEVVKPAGQPFPDEFASHATDKMLQHWYDWIYGSIVKFGPHGGNIWLKVNKPETNKPSAEPVALPASLPKVKVNASWRGDANEMQGHLWMAPGVAHVGDMGMGGGGEHCHCTGCDFDIDGFARVFAPDNGRQRVTVLDSNGNVVLHFGAYGNQDYCGPDSYVLDPKENYHRSRKAGDPKDLASPFASPEIAFAWIVGLAVTDRHAYVCDSLNRRMLRVKLGYQAEESVPVP